MGKGHIVVFYFFFFLLLSSSFSHSSCNFLQFSSFTYLLFPTLFISFPLSSLLLFSIFFFFLFSIFSITEIPPQFQFYLFFSNLFIYLIYCLIISIYYLSSMHFLYLEIRTIDFLFNFFFSSIHFCENNLFGHKPK